MFEHINTKPVERIEQTTRRTDLDVNELRYTESLGEEVSSVKSEKRWVDVSNNSNGNYILPQIIDEQLSQPSPITSPIPVDTKSKTTVTEHRWVDVSFE